MILDFRSRRIASNSDLDDPAIAFLSPAAWRCFVHHFFRRFCAGPQFELLGCLRHQHRQSTQRFASSLARLAQESASQLDCKLSRRPNAHREVDRPSPEFQLQSAPAFPRASHLPPRQSHRNGVAQVLADRTPNFSASARALFTIARKNRHLPLLPVANPKGRARRASSSDDRTTRIASDRQTFASAVDKGRRIGVVACSSSSSIDDCVHRADFSARRFDPIEMIHHRDFVRRSHAQAAQVPIDLARARMDHALDERSTVSNFKRNVDGVHAYCFESCVVHVRRN